MAVNPSFKLFVTTLIIISFVGRISLANTYTLQVYGDIGQNEEFVQNKGTIVNDKALFQMNRESGECKKINGEWVGLRNFNNILKANNNICDSHEIVVLGDNNYVEIGKVSMLTKDSPDYQAWLDRLYCNFYLMRETFKRVKCPTESLNPLKYTDEKERYQRLNLILGNHSYNINYLEESNENLKISAYFGYAFDSSVAPKDIATHQKYLNNQEVSSFPVMQVRFVNGIRVEFLDINVLNIYCYLFDNPEKTEEKFNQCFYKKAKYGIFYTFAESKLYTERLILALNSFTPLANWRALRLHHPIFNIAGFLEDESIFWRETVDASGNSLLDLLKKNNVNLVLVGHNHTSQVLAYPYSKVGRTKDVFRKNDATWTLGLPKKVVDVNLVTCPDSGCINRPKCYFNDKLLGGKTESASCDYKNNKEMIFKHNNRNPANLLILVVGTGKIEDAIEADQKTPGSLLWGRAVDLGGAQITFKEHELEASFFEMDKSVFSFKTKHVENDRLKVLEDFVEFKLSGDNVSKEKPDTIVPFNYKQGNKKLSFLS